MADILSLDSGDVAASGILAGSDEGTRRAGGIGALVAWAEEVLHCSEHAATVDKALLPFASKREIFQAEHAEFGTTCIRSIVN